MNEEIALAGILAFLWGTALAGATRGVAVSGPMIFAAAGLVAGPAVFGSVRFGEGGAELLVMAEYALALVLFVDAARADFTCLRGHAGIPERLLLLALPLTVVLGALAAKLLFPALGWIEAFLLGALVAPTDAALGLPVVENERVPEPLREGLKFESGLNDGLMAPLVLILLALASGDGPEGGMAGYVLEVSARGFGIGLATGAALGGLGSGVVHLAWRRGWRQRGWRYSATAMLAFAAYALTDLLGGTGFIGAFVGGLVFGGRHAAGRAELDGAGEVAAAFALVTWLVFGAELAGPLVHAVTWQAAVFAALALGVVRMVPVVLAFAGSGLGLGERLFLGWFGPRGLASVVFALLIAGHQLPGESLILGAASCTIAASVVLHGITAHFAARFAARFAPRSPGGRTSA